MVDSRLDVIAQYTLPNSLAANTVAFNFPLSSGSDFGVDIGKVPDPLTPRFQVLEDSSSMSCY